jgi:hypothetical protein
VSEWVDMFTGGLLFQWISTMKIQLSVFIYYKADLIIISLKINLFLPWYGWKIAQLVLNTHTHSNKSYITHVRKRYALSQHVQ